MALEYGYVITIEKSGTSHPNSVPTNQWQKRDPGQHWTDISGATGTTYTVKEEDTSCDIRLVQDFSGVKAYSNSLTVTSVFPGCPYPDPTGVPHINAVTAENGDTLVMDNKMVIAGVAESEYPPTWYGILNRTLPYNKEVIQYNGSSLVVTDEIAQKYEYIQVTQRYEPAASLDPLCIGFSPDSLLVPVSYVPSRTFGNTTLSAPSVVEVGKEVTIEVNYDGDVTNYTAVPKWPTGYADFVSEDKRRNKYSYVIKYHTPGTGRVEATLTSTEQKTAGENPVSRDKSIEAKPAAKTLGIVSLTGPDNVEVGKTYEYTLSWTGDATEEEVDFVFIKDNTSDIEDNQTLTPKMTWKTEGTDKFLWAQASYEGDVQMPMIDPIVAEAPKPSGTFIHKSGGQILMSGYCDGRAVITGPNGFSENVKGAFYNIVLEQKGEYELPVNQLYTLNFRPGPIGPSPIFDFDPNFYTGRITNFSNFFYCCTLFNGDVSNWDTSNARDMSYMFTNAKAFNQDISGWDTSKVTTMWQMFSNCHEFNQDIGGWNTSKVTTMGGLFYKCHKFDQDISGWDVSNVENMDHMFLNASVFNQDIGGWNTSNAVSMNYMLSGCSEFNQDIGDWNTSNVVTMEGVFCAATVFNQDIGSWDTSKVQNMHFMFYMNPVFDQDISGWNTSKVKNLCCAFSYTKFNRDIGGWNTSSVTNLKDTFHNASAFNQDIGGWNTSKVKNMQGAFHNASAFNQDISSWNTSNVGNMEGMFRSASVFNQDIGGWDTSIVAFFNSMFHSASVFNQDLSSWCVSNGALMSWGRYEDFDKNSGFEGQTSRQPQWGTCP